MNVATSDVSLFSQTSWSEKASRQSRQTARRGARSDGSRSGAKTLTRISRGTLEASSGGTSFSVCVALGGLKMLRSRGAQVSLRCQWGCKLALRAGWGACGGRCDMLDESITGVIDLRPLWVVPAQGERVRGGLCRTGVYPSIAIFIDRTEAHRYR